MTARESMRQFIESLGNGDRVYTTVGRDWAVRRVLNTTRSRPQSEPRRLHGAPVECCECCGLSTDSEAHLNHCRG
jgi:hypothetical protein